MGVFIALMYVDKHLGVKNVPNYNTSWECSTIYLNGHSYVINKTKITENIKQIAVFLSELKKMGLGGAHKSLKLTNKKIWNYANPYMEVRDLT